MKLSEIIKTEDIIKISPSESLSTTLSRLMSSHDAAFIFDGDNFKGLVNPYHCIIKTSYPGNAKTQNCLSHPPKVHITDSISAVADKMSSTRLHYLPVFNQDDGFAGIISARRLLRVFENSAIFNIPISEVLKIKNRPIITIFEDDILSHALALFKLEKVSKLVVVNRNGRLKGLLSYYDLISYLVAPKVKEGRGDKVGVKTNLRNLKVRNFAKNFVMTLNLKNNLFDALKMILDRKIGSVVIMDDNRFPVGIITTRDFLNLIRKNESEKPIIISSKNLSTRSRTLVGNFFHYLRSWIKKTPEVARAKLFVKEEKGGSLFKVVLSLFPFKGHPKVYEQEGKNLPQMLQKVKNSKKRLPQKDARAMI